MDSILSSFHLDINTFGELLQATKAIVAGSAALAAYDSDKFTPNDLDIWVHSDFFSSPTSPTSPTSAYHPGVAVRLGYTYLFSYFLKHHGYKEVRTPHQSDAEYTSNTVFAILRSIQRFQHSTSGKVIQVMHCKVPVKEILDSFDLSVAKTWWEVSESGSVGFLRTSDPEALAKGHMYFLRESATEREKSRIEKYEARGFTLVPNPE